MDFALSEEQQAFQAAVRRWVDAEAPKSWAREIERREQDYPFELWDKLTAAGFHGIGIDEEYGGQGGDIIMQMLFARELSQAPSPLAFMVRPSRSGDSCRRSLQANAAFPSVSPNPAVARTYSERCEPKQCAATAAGSSAARKSGVPLRTLRTTCWCSRAQTRTSRSVTRA